MILRCLLGVLLINFVVAFSPRELLGAKECSWGPSYWCKNITNSKNCHAVKHCIQTVWQHQKVPEDGDDICGLCKNMVKQAREQLRSNETVNDIKLVFEGTCKLLHIKPVMKECMSLADNYAQELVDMLSSTMNPEVICTVAGLCNNEKIDRMLEDIKNKEVREEERNKELQINCDKCMDFADIMENRIKKSKPDEIVNYLSDRCRSLGSFSDACANLVDKYSTELLGVVNDFSPASFCYLTASCVNGYARKIHVKTESDVGVIHVNSDAISAAVKHTSDDQACELCKTVINHLEDILLANTTETEFKQMLKTLCKQTGKFSNECLSLADEYYDKIYRMIINDLDGNAVCSFAGVCTKPSVYYNGPVAPLLPEFPLPDRGMLTGDDEERLGRLTIAKPGDGVQVFTPPTSKPVKVEISFGDPLESKFQLPIERMALPSLLNDTSVNSKEVCVMCQYFLHYVQKIISQPYGTKAVENAVRKVCDMLPSSVTVQCRSFVDEYGDAFAAILAQEIDPSQVCPLLRVCPARILKDKYDPIEIDGKPGCPLCLMAVEDVTEKLKDNKTEDSIRHALHSLCTRMPKSLKSQCDDFVQKYTEQVVDMILADFTPQEVCTFLKLCKANVDVELVAPVMETKHELLTNEIPRGDAVHVGKRTPPMCFLCEFVMDKIEERLKNNGTEDVKRIVMGVCNHMPASIRSDCQDFVQRYSKYIVDMLEEDVDPKMVCHNMHMCREQNGSTEMSHLRRAVEECAMCEALVGALRGLLEDPNFDRDMARHALQICSSIPRLRPDQIQRCRSMIISYGPSIINLLVEFEVRPALICPRLGLCDETEQMKVHVDEKTTTSRPQVRPHLLGGNSCTWGPSYWCQSEDHAKECGTLAHCREVVWKADKPPVTVA